MSHSISNQCLAEPCGTLHSNKATWRFHNDILDIYIYIYGYIAIRLWVSISCEYTCVSYSMEVSQLHGGFVYIQTFSLYKQNMAWLIPCGWKRKHPLAGSWWWTRLGNLRIFLRMFDWENCCSVRPAVGKMLKITSVWWVKNTRTNLYQPGVFWWLLVTVRQPYVWYWFPNISPCGWYSIRNRLGLTM